MACKGISGLYGSLTRRSNTLCRATRSQNNATGERTCTRWKDMKTFRGAFWCQSRQVASQSSQYVVQSPYKQLDFPNITLPDLLWDRIDRFPDFTAIECGISGRKYTFAQIKKLSQRFAVSLLKSGIRQGQTVAVVSPNCPEYPIVVLGCMEAGVVVTLINYVYTADEICHQLKDSEAVCVITPPSIVKTAVAAISKVNESTKGNQQIKLLALDLTPDGSELPSGVGRFSDLINDQIDTTTLISLRESTVNPSSLAILPYSSGTTGLAKGVQLSHNNLVSNILQMAEATAITETTKDHQDVLPGVLPFYHIYGFSGIMAKTILFGAKTVTLPRFEPQTFLNVLKTQKCSLLYIVPPLVLFLGGHPNVTSEHFQHVHSLISGAAPIGRGDFEKLIRKVPKENNVISKQAYGLTETSPCISLAVDHKILSTIGSPLSNTMMKVISIENGDSLGPNQTGEVCCKGPQVMLGYHNNPKATEATIDSEGWLRTGDIGHYDEDGRFYIADRIKELIKVKGFQVPPAELEELLRSMPGVKDAGVVGVPDKRAGEVPVAYVVPSPSNPASVADIKTYMSERVADYKQLSDIVFVDSIPKSASGKILRRAIKESYVKSKQK